MRLTSLAALLAVPDDKVDAAREHLERLGKARPRRVKALANTLRTLFGKALDADDVERLIDALRHSSLDEGGKVGYPALPEAAGSGA